MAAAGEFPHWVRGRRVGVGSFGTVDLAVLKSGFEDQLMVVKSSEVSMAGTLRNEKEILLRLGSRCPEIVKCFGDCRRMEDGRDLYNLLFEYADCGSLADCVRGNGLPEMEVRRHAKSVLRGLNFVHGCGFVHCDVKLQNLLLFSDGKVKIADFGLAKERSENQAERGGFEFRGTPLYMSPEAAAGGGGEAPADVWALGCAVVEMATGKPAWSCEPGCGVGALLCRIAAGEASPEIPESMSEEGRDFLSKCFEKDPNERWTARMLLGHPFVSGVGEEEEALELGTFPKTTPSPRCPFDFPDSESAAEWAWSEDSEAGTTSFLERVETLAGNPIGYPDWSDSDGWVRIR